MTSHRAVEPVGTAREPRVLADDLATDPPTPRRAPVSGAPWLPRAYVPRPVLWERLDADTPRAVTMVVAPAGAGKTLGVAGWLQHSPAGRTATWVSADKSMRIVDLEAVLSRARLGGAPHVVVIDDAHRLRSACIRHLDRELAERPEGLHLVLLTRWDLALSRLVPELLGDLNVIRGDVLRLTDDEAYRLIAAHARTRSPEVRDAIVERAQGWCAAVVLAARASAAASSHEEFIRRFRGSGLGVADLVADEVFASLPSRARHLLLCTATERVVTSETAVHLTRDPLAGETLDTLESTGLLVSRVGSGPDDTDERGAADVRYRVHPLLLEVTRRRLTTTGVDVQQAHATALRATRLDLARGQLAEGFRRLVALGEYDEAAAVLDEHGPRLLADGDPAVLEGFVRRAGSVVEQHPAGWATIAWGRWLAGNTTVADHWSSRVLRQHRTDPGSVPLPQVLSVRLHATRAGGRPVLEAVATAREALEPENLIPAGGPYKSLLLLELGVGENWLGDLSAAEHHLSDAVVLSRAEGLDMVTAEALGHLALTQFMAGREGACLELAGHALELCDANPGVLEPTRARAEVALRLATFQASSWAGVPADALDDLPPVPDDLTGRFWHWILAARLALVSGSPADAQRRLGSPPEMPALADHLLVNLLVERALHALTLGNPETLREVADQLGRIDAPGERAWVEGALADLNGDLRHAAALYLDAAAADCGPQPATAVLGLVSAAQLHHHLVDPPPLQELITRAVSTTEARGNAVPFLGWSSHGTRVGRLLEQVPEVMTSTWGTQLWGTFADLPGVTTIFRPLVGTSRELGSVVEPTVTPLLSPREHEVLGELARGSTYSDIAANLYVSENTVKTHISSLYSKLSVGRRSEALAVARKLHLL